MVSLPALRKTGRTRADYKKYALNFEVPDSNFCSAGVLACGFKRRLAAHSAFTLRDGAGTGRRARPHYKSPTRHPTLDTRPSFSL